MTIDQPEEGATTMETQAQRLLSVRTPTRTGPAGLTVAEGDWGEQGGQVPCLVLQANKVSGGGLSRSALRTEIQTLRLLANIDGVPRLLHAEADLLVESLAPGMRLSEMAPERLCVPVCALRIALNLSSTLERIHSARVFHTGITPDVIFVDPTTDATTLTGFGQSVLQSHIDGGLERPTLSGVASHFQAPEQTGRTERTVDYRADHYALGAVLYWMLTGQPPFDHDEALAHLHALLTQAPAPPSTLNPTVSRALDSVVLKLLAKDPDLRYQWPPALQADLRHCLSEALGETPESDLAIGRLDHRVRPSRPARLFDRDEALRAMADTLNVPPGSHSRAVLVRGYAGAGKSALVQAMWPEINARRGILAQGKFERFRRATPFSAVTSALSDLADHWLSEPPENVAALRATLRERLGSNLSFLAYVVTAMRPLLLDADAAVAESGASPDQDANLLTRLQHALAAVLETARDWGRPLVLFIDDRQSADADALQLLQWLAREQSRDGVLLIGAYRDNEVGPLHPLSAVLAELRRNGSAPVEIVLGGLSAAGVQAMVADSLHGLGEDIAPLAAVLHRKTDGNAFFVLEYIRQLFDAGHLVRDGAGWQWSARELEALPNSENLVDGLVQSLRTLPHDAQMLAGTCACIGHTFEVELLAEVLAIDPLQVDALLLPLVQRDLLLQVPLALSMRSNGSAATTAVQLKFAHDRMQQAAHDLLGRDDRIRQHLVIARALQAKNGASQFVVAEHLLEALPLLTETPQCRSDAMQRMLAAAESACACGAFENALRFAEGGASLAADPADSVDPGLSELRAELDLVRHRALWCLMRLDEADVAFEAMKPRLGTPERLCDATWRQMESLHVRRRDTEAVGLGLEVLALLGMEGLPAAGGWEAAAQKAGTELLALLDGPGTTIFANLPPLKDARLELVSLILVALIQPARNRPQHDWVKIRCVQIGLAHGRSEHLASALVACFSWDPDGAENVGHALARAGMAMLERHYPDARGGITARLVFMNNVSRGIDDWEDLRALAEDCWRRANETGQPVGVFAFWSLAPAAFEIESDLARVWQVLEQALDVSVRAQAVDSIRGFRLQQRFIQFLRGQVTSMGSFTDIGFPSETADPEDSEAQMIYRAWMLFKARGAFFLGDWETARSLIAQVRPATFEPAHVNNVWFYALTLCHALRLAPEEARQALKDELEPLLEQLEDCERQSPRNAESICGTVRAMYAWALGSLGVAARQFQAAIDASLRNGRPYHHALACELAGEFCAACSLTTAADSYLRDAIGAYAAWGATVKVAALRQRYPHLAAYTVQALETEADKSLDLRGVIEANRVLAQERDPDALVRLLFDLVRQYAAAERGVLFWYGQNPGAEQRWTPRAGFAADGIWLGDADADADADADTDAGIAPPIVIRYLAQTLKPLLIPDVSRHPLFGTEASVVQAGIKSLIGLPIRRRGQTLGLLYLENRQAHTTLDAIQVETLGLISQQFAVAFENAQMNRQLEAEVVARTKQLREENAERQRAEAAAAAANRAKSDFLATMSHEIRTPLNAILGMSHLALQSGLDARQAGYVRQVSRSARLLLALINDILDFSKIEAGKLSLEHIPFDLRDVIDTVAELIGHKAQEKGVELLFDLPAEVPVLLVGDPLRLGQVLTNFGSNAVKFTDAGQVVIRAQAVNPTPAGIRLRFSVLDSGIGISAEDQRRLFQPFTQADQSTTRRYGGTGLGLAISRQLVGLMAGEVGLSSQVGVGSDFHFTATFGAQHGDGMPSSDTLDALGSMRVLVVHDNRVARELLPKMVRALGMEADAAGDSDEALRLAEAAQREGRPFQIALVDAQLQAMDGIACALTLRAETNLPALLMATPFDRNGESRLLVHAPLAIEGVVMKPLTTRSLLRALSSHFGIKPKLPLDGDGAATDQFHGLRVLLAEDDVVNQEVARAILGQAGIEVVVADDGQQALERLGAERFDLVLMDCQMPVMDGYEAARILRTDPRWADLPVIAMTANAMVGDREAVLAAGMNDYVTKPIEIDVLFRAIARWVSPHR